MHYKLITAISTLTIALGLVALSNPATAACIFANGEKLSNPHLELTQMAQARISSRFGSLQSKPVIYFFDDPNAHWPLTLNLYGSTSFLGYKTCVAIGPHGQNIDVVAHELMHAEIESHAGFWSRTKKLPTWFDEGLAMQVDFRERYNLDKGTDYAFVTKLESSGMFFVSDKELLIKHYSAAKAAVTLWLSQVNDKDVYSKLNKLKEGSPFETIWHSTQ